MNTPDAVALTDRVQYGGTSDHPAEDRIDAVEVRLRRMRDEILAPSGVRSRQRHAHRSGLVAHGVDLVADREAGAAPAVAARIAVLHDEVRDDAMPPRPIEIASRDQLQEYRDGERRLGRQ